MMSVRVCTVKCLRIPDALMARFGELFARDGRSIQKMSSVMKTLSRFDLPPAPRPPAAGDFSRKVLSWNFHTEQKLHLNGQPRAVSISASGLRKLM